MEVRNRFKGLDLIDRVPEKLWTDVSDIAQGWGSLVGCRLWVGHTELDTTEAT